MQRLLNTVQDSEVSPVQRQAMEGMCHHLNIGLPHSFNLATANSAGVLVHWKVVLLISATLNEEEREYWRTNFPEDGSVTQENQVTPVIQEPVYPAAIDSHFHQDRALDKLRIPACGTLKDLSMPFQ